MFRAFLDMVDDIGWGRALGSVLLFALCAGVLVGLVTLTSRLVERRISSRGLGLTVRGVLGLILGAADGILFSYFVQYVWEGRVYLAVSLAMGVFGAVFGLLLGVGWTGKGVKFGAAACSFILLGAFLLTVPEFRARPDTLSVTDALPGLGAILAGVGFVGLMVWSTVRHAPAPAPKKESLVAEQAAADVTDRGA